MIKVEHPLSKRFKEATAKVDPKRVYTLEEAVALAKATSTVKFDAGIDAHIKLGINTKKSDQQVRSTTSLPHGTGKKIRVAVFTTDGDLQKAAKAAGADLVGDADITAQVKDGKINFDVLVATSEAMKLLAPLAKILGPKGLMPNPKDGTVTNNVAEAVANLKKGKVSFKNDDSGNLHIIIGRVSFTENQLAENFKTVMDSIMKAKPSTVKGSYIRSVSIASSMGPGIKVSW